MLVIGGLKPLDQGCAVFKIRARQHRHELVSAHAVDRAVLEHIADLTAGLADVFVARLVTAGVVDGLQSVEIAPDHGEGLGLLLLHQRVPALLRFDEGMLALYTRQCVAIDLFLGQRQCAVTPSLGVHIAHGHKVASVRERHLHLIVGRNAVDQQPEGHRERPLLRQRPVQRFPGHEVGNLLAVLGTDV